ncbi:MAG: ester cyclase [Terracidiphilus sp.]
MPANPTQVFQQYTDAWNRHDAAAIVATFAAGGTYTDPVTPGPLCGEAIGAYAQSLWDAFPDLSFETLSSIENGDGLLSAEWLMKGTNTGSLNGLPPTGKSISLSGADFVRVEGGRICSVQGYFDGGAVPRSLGLDVIVQPSTIGPFEFGVSARVSSGNKAVPGAFSLTNIEARNDEEKATIRDFGRQISQDMLSMPGFISVVTATVGSRMMTIAAWENQESMAPLMKGGAHRVAVDRYFRSELGRAGMTGIWIPGRLNPRRVRCEACSKMAPVRGSEETCSCGATLPDPIEYW